MGGAVDVSSVWPVSIDVGGCCVVIHLGGTCCCSDTVTSSTGNFVAAPSDELILGSDF